MKPRLLRTAKTWIQLKAWATRRKLVIYIQGGATVVHRAHGDRVTLATIHTGKALTSDDGDRIARAAVEAVLRTVDP